MACCVALGLFIALLRACWNRLTFRAPPPRILFAPVARRPAPGEDLPSPVPPTADAFRSPGHSGPALFLGAGLIVYLLVMALLIRTGLLVSTAETPLWLLRSVLYAALAAWLLRPAARREHHVNPAATALYFSGAAWLVAAIADRHLFGLYATPDSFGLGHHPATPTVIRLFYGIGFSALAAGLLLFRPDASRSPVPEGAPS